MAGTQSRSRHA